MREAKITLDLPDTAALETRLAPVLTTIYLLFNEGYYSISQNTPLRKALCLEAMRLCRMLVENESTDQPPVNALLALMCFHASRFDARMHSDGEIILYAAQDTSLWNQELISQGGYFLQRATTGNTLSRYHLEAGIAYWNTQKEDTAEKWAHILHLYNRLLQLEYSPVAALNRTYALSKANGKKVAIAAAEKLDLSDHHFYWALLGELYKEIDSGRSRQHFQQAWMLAKTTADKTAIQKEIDRL